MEAFTLESSASQSKLSHEIETFYARNSEFLVAISLSHNYVATYIFS